MSLDPGNLDIDIDLSNVSLPNRDYPTNYGGNYISDLSDKFELGHFGEEIFFDMTREDRPVISGSKFLLKRWTRNTIYAKSGEFNRTDNLNDNLYSTNSIYLYDYVVVNKDWFSNVVYTASFTSFVPGSTGYFHPGNKWVHNADTFQQSPNLATNNFALTSSFYNIGFNLFSYDTYVNISTDTYFEISQGYPRNHFTHKRDLFSLFRLKSFGLLKGNVTSGSYLRNSQDDTTTIGSNGLEDGSSPIQTFQVGNLNLVQTDNVINR
jgi:hypothetical protein